MNSMRFLRALANSPSCAASSRQSTQPALRQFSELTQCRATRFQRHTNTTPALLRIRPRVSLVNNPAPRPFSTSTCAHSSTPSSTTSPSTTTSTSTPSSTEPTRLPSSSTKLPTMEGSYELTFTCKPCRHRSTHSVSKQGYHHGAVLVMCPGCKVRHVICDQLGIFSDTQFNIEEKMKEKGELVKRGRLGSDGTVEFWDDGYAENPS